MFEIPSFKDGNSRLCFDYTRVSQLSKLFFGARLKNRFCSTICLNTRTFISTLVGCAQRSTKRIDPATGQGVR